MTQLIREKDVVAGLAKFRYLKCTVNYKKFKDLECLCALNFINNSINLIKQICDLPND